MTFALGLFVGLAIGASVGVWFAGLNRAAATSTAQLLRCEARLGHERCERDRAHGGMHRHGRKFWNEQASKEGMT